MKDEHFEFAFEHLIMLEGGYVDDPMDSGGKTKYGITESVAREHGYHGSMKDLSLEKAKEIYRKDYWDALCLDDVSEYSYDIAYELFDTGVNMGVVRATKFLQRSLNVLNNRQSYYDDLSVDGVMGNKTITAFNAYMEKRKTSMVLLRMLNCLQGAFYIDLAERREKDERFIYGWFLNRISLAGQKKDDSLIYNWFLKQIGVNK